MHDLGLSPLRVVVPGVVLSPRYSLERACASKNTLFVEYCFLNDMHDDFYQADADILCLQEVQADHFEKDLSPFLDSLGYSGHYDQKTRESMGQAGKVILTKVYELIYILYLVYCSG